MLVLGVLSIAAAGMVTQLGGPEAALDAVKKSLKGNNRGGFGVLRADDDLAPKRKWLKLSPKAPASPNAPAPPQPPQPLQLAQPKAASAVKPGKVADKQKEEPLEQALTVSGPAAGNKRRKLFKDATNHVRTTLTSLGNKLVRRK